MGLIRRAALPLAPVEAGAFSIIRTRVPSLSAAAPGRFGACAGAVLLVLAMGLTGCARVARFQAVAAEARAAEAPPVLRQAFVLQESFRASNGRFAATFSELAEAGWEDAAGLRQYHPPRIVRAGADELCIEMLPLRDDLPPQHVDLSGQVRPGRCA